MRWEKRLGEKVGKVAFGVDRKKLQLATLYPLTNDMAVNVHMFALFMKDPVFRNMNGSFVVKIHEDWMRMRDPKVFQQGE
uniref:Uncharacterized protein n=1 Tax=Cannabis sativa TaxID=3483 RepID=A0A803PSQ0_CANSA